LPSVVACCSCSGEEDTGSDESPVSDVEKPPDKTAAVSKRKRPSKAVDKKVAHPDKQSLSVVNNEKPPDKIASFAKIHSKTDVDHYSNKLPEVTSEIVRSSQSEIENQTEMMQCSVSELITQTEMVQTSQSELGNQTEMSLI
jgi:hypothetical protein